MTHPARVSYSPPEVARMLGVDPLKVLTWIRRGELPAWNAATAQGGRPRWRIDAEALADFKARRAARPSKPAAKRQPRRSTEVIQFF